MSIIILNIAFDDENENKESKTFTCTVTEVRVTYTSAVVYSNIVYIHYIGRVHIIAIRTYGV